MNKQQRRILINFAVVTSITLVAAFGMIELRNWVSLSESTRAMEQLGRMVNDYKQKNGSMPSESYVIGNKEKLEGKVRMGNLIYRARWIGFDSPPDTILAYVRKDYDSRFYHPGAIVLRLDGEVVWMNKESFDKLLSRQQSPLELELTPAQRL